jgi:hypothetical protein
MEEVESRIRTLEAKPHGMTFEQISTLINEEINRTWYDFDPRPNSRFLFNCETLRSEHGYGLASASEPATGSYMLELVEPSLDYYIQVTPLWRIPPIPNAETMFLAVQWLTNKKVNIHNYAARLDGLVLKDGYKFAIEIR